MKFLYRVLLLFCLGTIFFIENSLALPSFKQSEQQKTLPTILKADEIDADQVSDIITATGNAEVSKGNSTIYANELIYDKKGGVVRAIGNVKIKNLEIANVKSTKIEMKDDFSSGVFFDSKMVFIDGSYLTSPEIDRETPQVTVLKKSLFSICPNPEISADNEMLGKERDLISIKSSKSTIDRNEEIMKMNHSVIRIYNVPVFYIPYFRSVLQSKKRESGFLQPSYVKSSNLGLGIRTPFYLNIAPNMDMTITPLIGISSQQMMINNEFRHINKYGEYKTNFEIANNKLSSNVNNDATVVARTNQKYRWNFIGNGIFDFNKDVGADFSVNTVSDRNYLRDYYFNYLNYTSTKVNLDYINGRNYNSIKTIRFQELENSSSEKAAPWVLPVIDSRIESKPLPWKGKFALNSNSAVIMRQDGLQYRRATLIPEMSVPMNWRGNLFNFDSKLQGDFYSLENNFKNSATNNFDSTQSNYKPEASINWKLPMMRKGSFNKVMIEPMANFVISSYSKNFHKLPNEDSNSSELSFSNLFVSDRISGYDRNEAGERASYGVKTSVFNKYGEFGLTIGQSYKKRGSIQDEKIRGFGSDNKSNFVGQAMYKSTKYFSLIYSFHLNESDYSNDVNQITAALDLNRFFLNTNYLLLRKSNQNLQEVKQVSFTSGFKMTEKWKISTSVAQDMVLQRTLSRSISIDYSGCCAMFGFSVTESNPSSLTKPQKTFNLNLSFKNL